MFKLKIQTGNDAFVDDTPAEVARILLEVITRLNSGQFEGILHDKNGPRVGEWRLTKR